MIRALAFVVVNTGTCFLPTFHPEGFTPSEGDRWKTVNLLIVDSSTCFGGTFCPNAPLSFFSSRCDVISSLADITLTEKGLVKREILTDFLEELKMACEETGTEKVDLQVGDEVHSPGAVFTRAYTPSSGEMLVDFSATFENDWKVFGSSRQNMATLVRHEISHIKATDQAIWTKPEAVHLPPWFGILVATPVTEAGAHLASSRGLVERYLELTVESSVNSFSNFDRENIEQLVQAVALIATVSGTVEEFDLDRNLVKKLFTASGLSGDPFISGAVDLSRKIQLEFYTQRKAGIQQILLTSESQDIWNFWRDHLRQTST